MNKNRVTSKKRSYTSSSKGSGRKKSLDSLRSGNLCASLSSTLLSKILASSELSRIEKKKSVKKSSRTSLPVYSGRSKKLPSARIPEDVAVHFGNFYGLEKSSKNVISNDTRFNEFPARTAPKSEFTRQMVHELEKLAGTEHYAKQISTLLEETVESPNYVVKQPPDDHLPYERSDLWNYPLWYKDPDKINYRSPNGESSGKIERKGRNVRSRGSETYRAPSSCTLIEKMSSLDNEDTSDVTDCENNYQSSLRSSETSFNSAINTEDETDYEQFKFNIFVK